MNKTTKTILIFLTMFIVFLAGFLSEMYIFGGAKHPDMQGASTLIIPIYIGIILILSVFYTLFYQNIAKEKSLYFGIFFTFAISMIADFRQIFFGYSIDFIALGIPFLALGILYFTLKNTNKTTKTILITLGVIVLAVIIAGIYKFNYLSGQDGYDVDGNKIENQTPNQVSTKTLEVIGVFGEMDGDSIELIGFDDNGEYDFAQKYSTIFSIPNLGDNYISVKQGDRVKISGEFKDNRIFSITKLTSIKNQKKEECEAQKNRKWKPQGKAQIPACLTSYSDGGKTCTSSSQCEGNCIKTHPEKPAMCEENSSKFGCKTTIENFEKGKGIMCID